MLHDIIMKRRRFSKSAVYDALLDITLALAKMYGFTTQTGWEQVRGKDLDIVYTFGRFEAMQSIMLHIDESKGLSKPAFRAYLQRHWDHLKLKQGFTTSDGTMQVEKAHRRGDIVRVTDYGEWTVYTDLLRDLAALE